MFQFLADALAFFYNVWPSYGGAIILFTLAIMLVLSPLSIKSARSMIAMQRVGPELKKIQAKHKNDREALNREMMAFYQDHGINPFSSCLPVLLQMPVFIVLYQVLSGLTRRIDLSRSALWELQNEGIVTALPYIALVALVVFTSFVQQRQIQGRNTGNAINPQQQMIGKILPFIFIPISITIPSGVVIYFVVSNAVRIGQQALVTKLDFSPKALAAAEAKREARLAAKGDVVDVESSVTERKGRGARGDAKRDAAAQEALPAAPTERAGRAPRGGATSPKASAKANGSGGSRSNGASRTTTSAVTSGRVTPAGSRPRSRKRKRK